jgi:hypothetical protein
VIVNPGFDTAYGIDNWSPSPSAATYVTDDANACPASGSARVSYVPPYFGSIGECVTVVPNITYHFGLEYKQDTGYGLYCYVAFYAGSTCSGGNLDLDFFSLSGASIPITSWQGDSISAPSPAMARIAAPDAHGAGVCGDDRPNASSTIALELRAQTNINSRERTNHINGCGFSCGRVRPTETSSACQTGGRSTIVASGASAKRATTAACKDLT